jgi:hypothetical protein
LRQGKKQAKEESARAGLLLLLIMTKNQKCDLKSTDTHIGSSYAPTENKNFKISIVLSPVREQEFSNSYRTFTGPQLFLIVVVFSFFLNRLLKLGYIITAIARQTSECLRIAQGFSQAIPFPFHFLVRR